METILGVQREVLQTSRDLKTIVSHGVPGGAATGGSQDSGNQQLALLQQLLGEVRENMNVVRREFGTLTTRLAGGAHPAPQISPCPATSGCISTTGLIAFLSIHLVIILGYLYYQSGRESQSKKFY